MSFTGGYSNHTLGDNSIEGFSTIFGFGGSVGGRDFNIGLYYSRFSGAGINQRIAGFTMGVAGAHFVYENDGAPFEKLGRFADLLNDGEDRWRTNAVALGYGDFELRLNQFTGEPTEFPLRSESYPLGFHTGDANMYRLGALSFGYRGYRAGWNSEGIRHVFQNKLAHTWMKPQPWFRRMPVRGAPFGGIISTTPYTLWWF